MRKFRFNLQKVLDYRETVEDKLMSELATIQAELDRATARLHDLMRARNRFREHMRQRLSGGSPDEIKQASEYLDELNNCLRAQASAVRRVTEARDGKLAEVLEASKDRKMLERLRDQRKTEHRSETEHQEQEFLDDIAGIHHSRTDAKADFLVGGLG